VKHSECLTKKFFDDESSDEQGNGAGAGGSSSAVGHQSSTSGGVGQAPTDSRNLGDGPGSGPCESIITITPAEDSEDGGGDASISAEKLADSTNHLRLSKSYNNGYTSDPDRHSCSDMAYAIEVSEDAPQRPSEHPPTALSLAKKGKKFFFSWFFLKKKSKGGGGQAEGSSPSTSVGIYKTKSYAELKLRSSSAIGGGGSKAAPNSMDVNMNS